MNDPMISPPIRRGVRRRKTSIDLDRVLREAALGAAQEQAVVVVHCTIPAPCPYSPYRIWRSTFLKDRHSGHRSKLLHAEGIQHPPANTHPMPGKPLHFALYFEALPTHCAVFDLVEHTRDLFPFNAPGIVRNRSDVYRVMLNERIPSNNP
jgi:hypothetical protein